MDIGHQGPDHRGSEYHSDEAEEARDHALQGKTNQDTKNTTVANQAYTFNDTTPHASINYVPGTFSIGAPFSTHHQVPYGYQSNQQQTQLSQQRVNSFTKDQSNSVTQTDTTVLLDQLQKLLNNHKIKPTKSMKYRWQQDKQVLHRTLTLQLNCHKDQRMSQSD